MGCHGHDSNGMALGCDSIRLFHEGTERNGLSTTLHNTVMGLGCTVMGGMAWYRSHG